MNLSSCFFGIESSTKFWLDVNWFSSELIGSARISLKLSGVSFGNDSSAVAETSFNLLNKIHKFTQEKFISPLVNLDELKKIRSTLRETALKSSVFNAVKFGDDFSKMLWEMWKRFEKEDVKNN